MPGKSDKNHPNAATPAQQDSPAAATKATNPTKSFSDHQCLITGEHIDDYLARRKKDVMERLAASVSALDEARLADAFAFAEEAHRGQLRKSGEPYLVHPVEVAVIVSEMNLDGDSIIAALLHDTIEDTGNSFDDIRARFGLAVASIVEGVTKLTRTDFATKEDRQMENLRKMFLAMARDVRVLIIKIVDRLHNMRTSEYWSESKRREKSLETMEIYAPLAHRLGMQRLKWELEDLALKNLDPVGYNEILHDLELSNAQHKSFLQHIQNTISDRMYESGIQSAIEGRVKHIYSIYRKLYVQHKAMFEIYDLYAVRVIVDSITDCYNVLGFIHDLYKPIPGRFKDYISTPKPNMYQSLHTTVIGREGHPFEVQIRTWDMHKTAENGIAAHWKYKADLEGDQPQPPQTDDTLAWIGNLIESQQNSSDAEEFIKGIKVDMFADEVFVFTPRGKVINLPNGAGIIDFAYAIHSQVGNRMQGGKVRGRMVNLEYKLQNGDIVEIVTGNTQGPSRDWLKMVKTSEARNKIRQWFKKERREENIAQGKLDFERELKRSGISLSTVLQDEICLPTLKKMSFACLDDLHAAIGYGGLTTQRVINRFRDELIRRERSLEERKGDKETDQEFITTFLEKQKREHKVGVSSSGVIVEGVENCMVKFSRCCSPMPEDSIVGFVTRGYGVSVHRSDCSNVAQLRGSADQNRWVSVKWASHADQKFITLIHIRAVDSPTLFMDIAQTLNETHFPITGVYAQAQEDGDAVFEIKVGVTGRKQTELLCSRLSKVKGVFSVKRA